VAAVLTESCEEDLGFLDLECVIREPQASKASWVDIEEVVAGTTAEVVVVYHVGVVEVHASVLDDMQQTSGNELT